MLCKAHAYETSYILDIISGINLTLSMNRSTITSITASLVALSFALAPVASANTLRAGVGVKLDTSVTASGTGASVGATTSANVHTNAKGEDDTNANASGSATSTMHREDNEDTSDIEVDHDSAVETDIDSPAKVTTRGELRSYLNHVMHGDDRVADVTVSSTTIETHYKVPARFLWVIPASLTADVEVASDGSVTVSYPWYSFLFSKKGSELKTELDAAASSNTAVSTTTALSPSLEAHLVNNLFAALKAGSK